jgi:glycosyltransferase involved in cell wall biosynthesis
VLTFEEKKNFSIIIPVYKSSLTIGELVHTLMNSYKKYDMEIILIDDGSEDETGQVIFQLASDYPLRIKSVQLLRNFGEHHAVMAGLHMATKDYVVIMDDDGQNPPEEVMKLIDYMVTKKCDVVYGIYQEKKHHFFRNFSSWFNGLVAYFFIKRPKNLYLSSFKSLSRPLYEEIRKYSGPYLYLDTLILRSTRRYGQMIVDHCHRKEGQSHYTWKKLCTLFINMAFSHPPLLIRWTCVIALVIKCLVLVSAYSFNWINEGMTLLLFIFILIFFMVMLIFGEIVARLLLSQHHYPQFVIREKSF